MGEGGGWENSGRKAICTGNVGLCHHFHSSHQKQGEAAGSHPACLQEQNICRFCNKMCPGLSLLRHQVSLPHCSPLQAQRGEDKAIDVRGTAVAWAWWKHTEGVTAPTREAWLEMGTDGGCISKSWDQQGPQTLAQTWRITTSISVKWNFHLYIFETCFANFQGPAKGKKTGLIWIDPIRSPTWGLSPRSVRLLLPLQPALRNSRNCLV